MKPSLDNKYLKRVVTLTWFFFGLYLGPKIDIPEYSWMIVFSPFLVAFLLICIWIIFEKLKDSEN